MKQLLNADLFGLVVVACVILLSLGDVHSRVHYQRYNISQLMGLHANLEIEKMSKGQGRLFDRSYVKADIVSDPPLNALGPISLFSMALTQDEDLVRCDNLTLIQHHFLNSIECLGVEGQLGNSYNDSLINFGYIEREIDYVNRMQLFYRTTSRGPFNSAGHVHLYPLKKSAHLTDLELELARRKQNKFVSTTQSEGRGYLVEVAFRSHDFKSDHSCSGEVYYLMNKTATIRQSQQVHDDLWPYWSGQLLQFALESHLGSLVRVHNFTCVDSFGELSLESDLLYIQRQEFPYETLINSLRVTDEIALFNHVAQGRMSGHGEHAGKELPASMDGYITNSSHTFMWLSEHELVTLNRRLVVLNGKVVLETSNIAVNDWFSVSWYHNYKPGESYNFEGRAELFELEGMKLKDGLLVSKWYDDGRYNYDLTISRNFTDKFQEEDKLAILAGVHRSLDRNTTITLDDFRHFSARRDSFNYDEL